MPKPKDKEELEDQLERKRIRRSSRMNRRDGAGSHRVAERSQSDSDRL